MKTIRILVSFCLAFTASTAQSEKLVTQIEGSDFCWGLDYYEDGQLKSIVDDSRKGGDLLWLYDYSTLGGSSYFQQYAYHFCGVIGYNNEPPYYRVSKLNADYLISKDSNENTYSWSQGEKYEYKYNDGRMVEMTNTKGVVVELSWTEGNLTQIVFFEDDEEEGRISCSYTGIPAKGICQAFNSPLMLLLDYYTIQSLGPLAHGYYGLLSQNLLSEMTISFSEKFMAEHYTASELSANSAHYPISNKKSRKYSYGSDSDGDITSITVSEQDREKVFFLKCRGNSTAEEYIDPQTNVVYTYEPGDSTASVKAGYEEVTDHGDERQWKVSSHSGSPDAAGDVVILDRFTVGTREYVVTGIGEAAFRENGDIKSVIVPETVTTIGTLAFASCDNLATLSLPASLTFVGRDAFNGTPWYASQYDEAPDGPFYVGSLLLGYKGEKPVGELVIREGTRFVNDGAFGGCDGLTSVTIPPSVVHVGRNAFDGCKGLTAVHITDLAAWCGIVFQSEYANSSNPLCYAHHLYLDGEEVKDLAIPGSVTSIGAYAFDKCTALTSVTIPDGVTDIGESAFDNCTALTSVTIPDGVTSIGSYAFNNCGNLASVSIPPSVSIIGIGAFCGCDNLEAVHISDLAAWCNISFSDWYDNPLSFTYAYLYLNGEEVKDLVIPKGVTSIGDGAFIGYNHLTSVTIPEGVTSIGMSAFNFCMSLAKVTISASVCSIGLNAFADDFSLSSVTSKIEEPFGIAENVFGLYDGAMFSFATLIVPVGTKTKYEATKGWKNFGTIVEADLKEELKGDVNGDNIVDVADIASVIDVMAASSDLPPQGEANADVNGDGKVDVADIATIISVMAAQPSE